MSAAEKFWAKVDAGGDCWLWTGALNTGGYGRFTLDGRRQRAHRVAYALLVSPVPDHLELDHLCRVRHCVNPDHLDLVTHAENTRRGAGGSNNSIKTHCPHGHPYDAANTVINQRGSRECRECRRARSRAHYRR